MHFQLLSPPLTPERKKKKKKDAIVNSLQYLISENGEDIQVLRYEHGQKYDPHYDYFADKVNIARGGHRVATVLMYLTDVTKGGETVFPDAEVCLVFHIFP